jgi:hypothetical protein
MPSPRMLRLYTDNRITFFLMAAGTCICGWALVVYIYNYNLGILCQIKLNMSLLVCEKIYVPFHNLRRASNMPSSYTAPPPPPRKKLPVREFLVCSRQYTLRPTNTSLQYDTRYKSIKF